MSDHDKDFKDSTGLGWIIITVGAFLFVTMQIPIALSNLV
jgi:hypothetical protein